MKLIGERLLERKFGEVMPFVPNRGDVIWLEFSPQAGHEQAGRRPALVLSQMSYNGKVGLAVVCPVTSRVKGYSFEVPIPQGYAVSGVVLADQVRNVDWQARNAQWICSLPVATVSEVFRNLVKLCQ